MDAAVESVESEVPAGQPIVEPSGNTGQSTKGEEQPSGVEESSEAKNTPNWEKDYKELQGKFTKESQQWAEMRKKAETYGGLDQLLQTAEYLTNNPDFSKWVESQQNKGKYDDLGFNDETLDDDTKKALDLVEQIAGKKASELVEQIIQQKVAPIEDHYKETILESRFDEMDSKYPEWRDLKDTMAELAEGLPSEIQDNPSVKDLEMLYFRALAETGKFDDYAASRYKSKLEATKNAASGKPSNNEALTPKQANTIAEAFELAKKAQN